MGKHKRVMRPSRRLEPLDYTRIGALYRLRYQPKYIVRLLKVQEAQQAADGLAPLARAPLTLRDVHFALQTIRKDNRIRGYRKFWRDRLLAQYGRLPTQTQRARGAKYRMLHEAEVLEQIRKGGS
jgi:hypothetical protein